MPTLINKKHGPKIAGEKDLNDINLPAKCWKMDSNSRSIAIIESNQDNEQYYVKMQMTLIVQASSKSSFFATYA